MWELLESCEVGLPGDTEEDGGQVASLDLELIPVSGGACDDASNATPGTDPFSDLAAVTVSMKGIDGAGQYTTLAKATLQLSGPSLTLPDVPTGEDRDVIVYGEGTKHAWYAHASGVNIMGSSDAGCIESAGLTQCFSGGSNEVDLLLAPFGDFACVEVTSNTYPNVVFPALAELGDGRVLITGGYTGLVTEPITLDQSLSGATDRAFIWDPAKGILEETLTPMPEGRAAHAAVFVPGAGLGKVLLIGGADHLAVDMSAAFPFALDLTKARQDYVIFDVATETFTEGKGKMELKRAFPRAHLMADNTVVITGGGEWPNPDGDYDLVEVFDMELEETEDKGGLLVTFGFATSWLRTGHSLTFIRKIEQGLSTLLVWGGTNETSDADDVASVLIQSNTQKSGDNGTFAKVDVYGEWPPFTYFHEMTPISGNRFVLTGGSRSDGTRLEAPADDEAWLITYDYNTETGKHDVLVEKIPGLGAGRVFHTSLTGDGEHLAILGGMGANHTAITSDPIMFLEPETGVWSVASDGDGFAPRAWHGSASNPSGAALLVGGVSSLNQLEDGGVNALLTELYTPSNVDLP
jgi:hypothetical protein